MFCKAYYTTSACAFENLLSVYYSSLFVCMCYINSTLKLSSLAVVEALKGRDSNATVIDNNNEDDPEEDPEEVNNSEGFEDSENSMDSVEHKVHRDPEDFDPWVDPDSD
ncbi:hypothetical protein FNV43_RR21664 [Rhamnella rubrinervis]|uniref:Uncharacterized protein n=1 Tax=Rhamnella rubrinervis TaxID=2594499 RepID=A0A8K0DUN6_9ROSA|nr:hypothetical protein FNV43_RR21664 [Rhamnella rubrinervis]